MRQKSRYTYICCHVSKDISGQGKNHIICRSIISKIIYDFFAEEIVQETNVKESKVGSPEKIRHILDQQGTLKYCCHSYFFEGKACCWWWCVAIVLQHPLAVKNKWNFCSRDILTLLWTKLLRRICHTNATYVLVFSDNKTRYKVKGCFWNAPHRFVKEHCIRHVSIKPIWSLSSLRYVGKWWRV